ncbi:hypothetical protein ElyMa_000992000 [Elysia marginata]|uniref:Uncharacterized protein n=1 Tax=Elysia marginata TaxID=1093978 RepID=A0AAV4HJ24_9GAST|nr:hypothetical protein ElyMa_000992000 [Elysia marginata]
MLGMGKGGRRRGRPCMRWKDDIKTVTGLTLSELIRAVENRDDWRQLITIITRSRPRLDGTSNKPDITGGCVNLGTAHHTGERTDCKISLALPYASHPQRMKGFQQDHPPDTAL